MPPSPNPEFLMRQRLGTVTRALPGALKGEVESLHQARVATRRLREALPIMSSGTRRRKLERVARKLTRAFGPVRELDVMLHMLDEIDADGGVPKAAVARLRRVVQDDRRERQHDMTRVVGRCDLAKLQKRALAAARKSSAHKSGSDERHAGAARGRAARRALRLESAIEHAAGLYLPDRLHEVRIAVKKLRYALELVGAVGRARMDARIRTLKKAQDLLGRMHDLEMLIARTRGVQGAAGAATLKLSGDLDRLVRQLETECRQLHSQYMALRKGLLTICDQVETDARSRPAA